MKPVIIIAIAFVFLFVPQIALAETEYVIYVEELPEWADYASNVVFESTQAWEKNNPDLKFYQTEVSTDANFRVQWVKEFGFEHIGYAYGNKFLEVGLGDSRCGNKWQPFSSNYINAIMEHEIGHILGLKHNLVDKNHIMYPIMLDWEYGLVENDFRLTTNYAEFIPFCTKKQAAVTIQVNFDEPKYGFDVYVVPSIDSLDLWQKGKPFEYMAGTDCSAKDVLKFTGICNDVAPNSGLLIITGNKLSNPLTTFDVKYQMESKDVGMTIPVIFPGEVQPKPEIKPIPEPTPEPIPEPIPEPEIIVEPDAEPKPEPVIVSNEIGFAQIDSGEIKLSFGSTEELKIFGKIFFAGKDGRIALTFTLPDGTTNGKLVFPKNDGSFETTISLDDNSPDGEYEIMVTSKQSLIGFLHFTLSHEHIFEQILAPISEPESIQEEEIILEFDDLPDRTTHIEDFPSSEKSPQYYVERYNNELEYQEWFDSQFPNKTISEIVDYTSTHIPNFPNSEKTPQYYIDLYNNKPKYKEWFDYKFPNETIYDILGIEPKSILPSWIKNNAGWWADGSIDDDAFLNGIQYLIKENILSVTEGNNDFETSSEIPEWVKKTAGDWADDVISKDDFITSIQFLIENGMVSVEN